MPNKFKWKQEPKRKAQGSKASQPSRNNASDALTRAQKNIGRQAALAVLTLVLTMVIVFAMTSAWYTNIVQTSGLVFQAEAWGFDGTITVDETPIVAAPGDVGTVNLEVENKGDITALSVNISKAQMDPRMQKRMYFYVDTQHTRNEETMERVYLNNQESYTYTIFNDGKLTLTEKLHNDAQIKWMWVYDVLGYYVLAEYDPVMGMREEEYLRPIEYNYDASTSTFVKDANGNLDLVLSTVDGTKTVEEFLQEVSRKDGYAGNIDTSKKYGNGYYPVEVKAVGKDGGAYGVFAYLCNYAEIEEATEFDTKLGQAAYQLAKDPDSVTEEDKEKMKYTATMTLSAQKSDSTVVSASTANGLQQAITAGMSDVVQLSSNVTISESQPLLVTKGQKVMLDLNGYTLQQNGEGNTIQAEPGSSITVINGFMKGTDKSSTEKAIYDYAVYANGAEVVFSNVNVEGYSYGVFASDYQDNNDLDSRIYISGGSISADVCGVFAQGNGPASEQKTQVVIEDATITGGTYAVASNATEGREGTDFQIINSTLTSTYLTPGDKVNRPGAAIYHPQKDGTMSIYNSTLSGYTGLILKGGFVTVTDSTITGLGAYAAAGAGSGGALDTGAAVYLENTYKWDVGVEITETDSGTTKLTSNQGYAFVVADTDTNNVTARIVSGTFQQPEKGTDKDGNAIELTPLKDMIAPYLVEGAAQTTTGTTVKVTYQVPQATS